MQIALAYEHCPLNKYLSMLIQHFGYFKHIFVIRLKTFPGNERKKVQQNARAFQLTPYESHERYLLFVLRLFLYAVLVLVVLDVQIAVQDAVRTAQAYVLIADRSETELFAQTAATAGELSINRLCFRIDRVISPFDRLVTWIWPDDRGKR